MFFFVVTIIVVAKAPDRHQTVCAGLVEGEKQAEPRDARNSACEHGSGAFGKIGGEITVQSVTLGRDGLPFGVRERFAEFAEPFQILGIPAVAAEVQGRNQGAVHDEVGIAPDG